MSGGITVKIDDRELKRLFEELERRGGNLAEVTAVIAESLVAAIADVFEQQGPGWPPLKPSTLRYRRGGKILQDTGLLVGSVHADSGPDFAEAYSDVPYGKFHITGTSTMERRDWTEIDFDAEMDRAAELLLAEIAGRSG